MIKRLTIAERQTAMLLSVLIALAGFAMAVIGRGDPMGVHGWIVLILAGALFFATNPSRPRIARSPIMMIPPRSESC